jgi:hypothetical protein
MAGQVICHAIGRAGFVLGSSNSEAAEAGFSTLSEDRAAPFAS